MKKKPIDLLFVDWWQNMDEKNFQNYWLTKIIQKYLGDKYELKLSNSPKYLFYGPFGDSHLSYSENCVRICIAFENIHIDWNLADYGVSTNIMDFGERNLSYPYYFLYQNDLKSALKKHLIYNKREKFCSFMSSNGEADKIRDEFFEKLCEYKKVDSGGMWKNNIGGPIGIRYSGDWECSKAEWLKNYKFNLCFENSAQKGYVTEKIIQSFASGCIPIYWGDKSLCDEKYTKIRPIFNPKAFVNVHNFDSIEDAIKEIERIDNDAQAYNAMRKEPIFTTESILAFLNSHSNFNGDLWNRENIDLITESIIKKSELIIAEFFDNIFEKGEKQIKYGQYLNNYFKQRRYDRECRLEMQKIDNKRKQRRKKLRQIENVFTYIPKQIRSFWRKV